MESQWGEIQRFLTFSWPDSGGKLEDVQVAVIRNWSVEDWITMPRVSGGPQVLLKQNATLLQVVDVNFLGSCAGRIVLNDEQGFRRHVIFEKTNGANVPQI